MILYVYLFWILAKHVRTITVSDKGIYVEYQRLLPLDITWSQMGPCSISKSLLYIQPKGKGQLNSKA
jgi:ABC-type tungstate transport system permease subunit